MSPNDHRTPMMHLFFMIIVESIAPTLEAPPHRRSTSLPPDSDVSVSGCTQSQLRSILVSISSLVSLPEQKMHPSMGDINYAREINRCINSHQSGSRVNFSALRAAIPSIMTQIAVMNWGNVLIQVPSNRFSVEQTFTSETSLITAPGLQVIPSVYENYLNWTQV